MQKLVFGLSGGIVGGLLVWWIASRAVDKSFSAGAARISGELTSGGAELDARLAQGRRELEQKVREQVQAQVPAAVDRQLRTTLARYGITEATGRQITNVLNNAERMGII
jgi:acyl-CoA synthetase (AMP-forming)/AMP-acid ligase II